ncbi:MAG TPA: SgcJ/EcaC family oxidoreductase [Gammaproteobacteria bacterium]|nr:SgcJ/EcaC family oxidoreductase [Gammaproteobacteria bacterium]
MNTEAGVSYKSWAALGLSAAFLSVFAFVGTQQIRERPATEEVVNTPSAKSSDEQTEVADQAKDVAPQVWESASRTDEAPESTVKELVQAWNQSNADKIAELFLPDGVLRLPTGAEIKSREEIRNTIAKHHHGMLKETKLTNSIEGVSTNGNNAVVTGNYELEGIKMLGFSTSSRGSYEVHGAKRDGRWLIAKAEVTRE